MAGCALHPTRVAVNPNGVATIAASPSANKVSFVLTQWPMNPRLEAHGRLNSGCTPRATFPRGVTQRRASIAGSCKDRLSTSKCPRGETSLVC